MAQVADIGGKRLISLAPDAWVQWVTEQSDVEALEIIGSDFQWVSRENDVLIKAHSPTQGDILIANELQLRYNDKMPARMRAYTALAGEKYGLPVYPVLINILPPFSTVSVADSFSETVLGLTSRQDSRVINLWEVEADLVFEENLNLLLPFVPILKNGGSQDMVQRALIQLQQDDDLVELESLLAFFAGFVLDTSVIQQIMRWDMTILRENPWYQEILREGEKKGIEQGERAVILRLLVRKLGLLPDAAIQKIQGLSLGQIERLGDALFEFEQLADLEKWLEQQS